MSTKQSTITDAERTLALRKAYAISLYSVDCLRIGMAMIPASERSKAEVYLADCMDSLADIQECIQGVFPNDKTLGD